MKLIYMIAYLSMTPAALGKKIKLAAPSYWCPQVCNTEVDKLPGIYIDIAQAVWGKKNVEFQNLPYERAINFARKGLVDAIPAGLKGEVPGFVFPKNEGSVVRFCFWGRQTDRWKFNGFSSLNYKRLGLIEGYAYPKSFNDYLNRSKKKGTQDIEYLNGADVVLRISKMVVNNRMDLLVDDDSTIRYLLKSGALKGLKNLGCIDEHISAYMCFSPHNKARSIELAKQFDEGINKLRKSGDLKKIFEKYGVIDWRSDTTPSTP